MRDRGSCQLSGDGEARRGFGSSFGNILKFGFELKNMVCHIFWPKAKQSGPRKEAVGARARNAVEDLNVGGHRRAALGVGRLSHRFEGRAKRHTTLWNPDRSASVKGSQAIKGVLSRIA